MTENAHCEKVNTIIPERIFYIFTTFHLNHSFFSLTGKGHVHILDGFILPMDPRGLLGFFGIGKLKQEDIILLSQATVVAYLPSIEQLKGELSIGHKFKDIRAQIFQAVYELEHRSFAPFKISVCHNIYFSSDVLGLLFS